MKKVKFICQSFLLLCLVFNGIVQASPSNDAIDAMELDGWRIKSFIQPSSCQA